MGPVRFCDACRPALFSKEGDAILMGRIAMPTLVPQAASPSVGDWLLSGFGPTATLATLFADAVPNILLVMAMLPFALRESSGRESLLKFPTLWPQASTNANVSSMSAPRRCDMRQRDIVYTVSVWSVRPSLCSCSPNHSGKQDDDTAKEKRRTGSKEQSRQQESGRPDDDAPSYQRKGERAVIHEEVDDFKKDGAENSHHRASTATTFDTRVARRTPSKAIASKPPAMARSAKSLPGQAMPRPSPDQ